MRGQRGVLALRVGEALLRDLSRHPAGVRGDGVAEREDHQRREFAADEQDQREGDQAAHVVGGAADELEVCAREVERAGLCQGFRGRNRGGGEVRGQPQRAPQGQGGAVVVVDVLDACLVEGEVGPADGDVALESVGRGGVGRGRRGDVEVRGERAGGRVHLV